MRRVTKVGLCLLAIAALLAAVGCGKNELGPKGEGRPLEFYPKKILLRFEEWGKQSLADTLAAQGGKVETFRIREGTEEDPTLSVIIQVTNVNPQAGEAISKMAAGFCLQAFLKYEQAAVIVDRPEGTLGKWIWSRYGELVEYEPPGYAPLSGEGGPR